MEEWRRTLLPRIAENKAKLGNLTLPELARRSGASLSGSTLVLPFLNKFYQLTQDLELWGPDGRPAPEEVQALLFDYLVNAEGQKPLGRWLGFRELPHGTFYAAAFQGYSGDELVRRLNREEFRRAAERAGGTPISLGDLAYAFQVLPLLPLAVVWWEGEEGLPPQATVLFDAVGPKLLPTEGLAIVGRLLCRKLVELGKRG